MRQLARSWRLTGGLMVLHVALSGCALFTPGYDAVLDAKATSAYEGVARLAANVELGRFSDPQGYEEAAGTYADIQAQLSVAALRASTLPVSGRGTAERARASLVSFIEGCRDQVGSLARMHETTGVPPGVGATQPMMVSCDQAARAARLMK